MPIRVEIYGAAGVAVGVVAQAGRLREVLESGLDLLVERAAWHPLDGSRPQPSGSLAIAEDDVMIAIADQVDDLPVHAQWHDIALDVGPYRVSGQIPTMPGFDPGRALARPTGEFVLLRDVRIALASDVGGGEVTQPAAYVNRYVVDRVAADLMLGFFFPGAVMVLTSGGRERSAAGAGSGTASGPAPNPGPATTPGPAIGVSSIEQPAVQPGPALA
jgi:hypothetical protein